MKILKCLLILLSIFNLCVPLYSEEIKTLEDIRKTLNRSSGGTSNKKVKQKFEIKSMHPCVVQDIYRSDKKRGDMTILGLEVTLRVNEKGDTIAVPFYVCYFYDKNKTLVERSKAQYWYPEGSALPKELNGDLFVKGKKDNRIIFENPPNIHYKYALCVIGNDEGADVAMVPKSSSPLDFEFDEKELYHAQ